MPQETQQKTFNFVKSSRGNLTLRPLPRSFQHLKRARRAFISHMEAIPTFYIIRLYGTSHIIKPLLRVGLYLVRTGRPTAMQH